jgi:ferredoxin
MFSAEPAIELGTDEEFTVVLGSSGREIPVASNETIASALRKAGIGVETECE